MQTSRTLQLVALAFVTGISGAVMPGPLFVAVLAQTALQGFRGMLWLVTGHALLELLTVGLLMAGLRQVMNRPRVRGGIGLIGGAALLWMAWDMARSVPGLTLSLSHSAAAITSPLLLVLWGAGVCAANPYFVGWWATVGAGQMAHMSPRTVGEYLAFWVGHELSDYGWYTLVALIVVTGRHWLTDSIYHGLIYVCAGLVAGLGVWFMWGGGRATMEARSEE